MQKFPINATVLPTIQIPAYSQFEQDVPNIQEVHNVLIAMRGCPSFHLVFAYLG